MLHALPILVSLLAQAAPGAGAAPQSKEKAQAAAQGGERPVQAVGLRGGPAEVRAAYALYPSPKLQFNIAQADRELGRTVGAVEAFEIFLMQAPDAAPELAAEARQSLAK